MKTRTALIVLIAVTLAPMAFAQSEVILEPFSVYSPRIMGQGGSASAVAAGYDALYNNPAAFADKKGSLTLGSFTAWGFAEPLPLLVATGLMPAADASLNYGYTYPSAYTLGTQPEDLDPTDSLYALPGDASYDGNRGTISTKAMLAFFQEEAKFGIGAGAAAGLGWVGGGLGLGAFMTQNVFLQGDTFPLGVSGPASTTFALVGGFALPIRLGPMTLSVGGDIRPMIRAYTQLDAKAVTAMMDQLGIGSGSGSGSGMESMLAGLNGVTMYQGAALAIDFGAKLVLGDLTVALSARDLFNTRFISMYGHKLGNYVNYLMTDGSLPPNTGNYYDLDSGTYDATVNEITDTAFIIPMNISMGAAFHPNLGFLSFFFDPTVSVDLVDPIGVIRDKQSPWSLLHFGADVKMLRFISLRAGINQGYVTAGFGVKLLFLDINASMFTRELGPYAGDRPNTGYTLEAALRF
jgi:hypothetical protein